MTDIADYRIEPIGPAEIRAALDPVCVTRRWVGLRRAPAQAAAVTLYDQKVWDSGTAGWCYYTKSTVDDEPAPEETVPNHTGTLSSHIVIGTRPA